MNPEPRVIAEVGGAVVAEQGPLVLVIDRATGPTSVVAFLFGIFALILGGFGVVTLITVVTGAHAPARPAGPAAVFLALGALSAVAAVAAIRRIRRSRSQPLHTYRPVAVFNRAERVFTDADGSVIAPLDEVRFERRMQVGSSSPKLVAVTPDGARILKRGNPFAGGIGNLDAVLTAAIHGVG